MSNSNCINLLLLSKRHKISKTNLINLLKNIELLDGNGKTLKSNSKFVIIDKENVLINEKYFYNEIIHTNNFSNLALTLNNNIPNCLIEDYGFTCFNEPTKTCLALGPCYPEDLIELTKKLQLYKD